MPITGTPKIVRSEKLKRFKKNAKFSCTHSSTLEIHSTLTKFQWLRKLNIYIIIFNIPTS